MDLAGALDSGTSSSSGGGGSSRTMAAASAMQLLLQHAGICGNMAPTKEQRRNANLLFFALIQTMHVGPACAICTKWSCNASARGPGISNSTICRTTERARTREKCGAGQPVCPHGHARAAHLRNIARHRQVLCCQQPAPVHGLKHALFHGPSTDPLGSFLGLPA